MWPGGLILSVCDWRFCAAVLLRCFDIFVWEMYLLDNFCERFVLAVKYSLNLGWCIHTCSWVHLKLMLMLACWTSLVLVDPLTTLLFLFCRKKRLQLKCWNVWKRYHSWYVVTVCHLVYWLISSHVVYCLISSPLVYWLISSHSVYWLISCHLVYWLISSYVVYCLISSPLVYW